MKTTILSLAFVLGLAVSFSACKKDKDQPASYFMYEGKTHEISYAQNTNDGGYSDFVAASADFSNPTYSGKVNIVVVGFNNEAVTAGTYTFKDDGAADYDPGKNFSYANAAIGLIFTDGQPDTSEATLFNEITAGTVTITKDGSNYTITYDLDFNGKKITGKYSGSVKQIN
jgi:hypothetical protein